MWLTSTSLASALKISLVSTIVYHVDVVHGSLPLAVAVIAVFTVSMAGSSAGINRSRRGVSISPVAFVDFMKNFLKFMEVAFVDDNGDTLCRLDFVDVVLLKSCDGVLSRLAFNSNETPIGAD
jgi:hypothetical protein